MLQDLAHAVAAGSMTAIDRLGLIGYQLFRVYRDQHPASFLLYSDAFALSRTERIPIGTVRSFPR